MSFFASLNQKKVTNYESNIFGRNNIKKYHYSSEIIMFSYGNNNLKASSRTRHSQHSTNHVQGRIDFISNEYADPGLYYHGITPAIWCRAKMIANF